MSILIYYYYIINDDEVKLLIIIIILLIPGLDFHLSYSTNNKYNILYIYILVTNMCTYNYTICL